MGWEYGYNPKIGDEQPVFTRDVDEWSNSWNKLTNQLCEILDVKYSGFNDIKQTITYYSGYNTYIMPVDVANKIIEKVK